MEKSLLLDFDGVLLRNAEMNRIVQHRATKFFSYKTKIPYDISYKLNNKFYKHYGHTVNFVKDLVPQEISMVDFNEFVYSPELLSSIEKEITLKDKCQFVKWQTTFDIFRTYNYNVKLFSNAPLCWINACIHNLCDNHQDLSLFDEVICFDNSRALKPSEQSYEDVYKNEEKILFVDDTEENLYYLLNKPIWTPILYDEKNEHSNKFFATINDPEMLLHYL